MDLLTWQWAAVFVVIAAPLVAAGVVLARSADDLAAATRLDGVFVGVLFVAGVTSLPELMTVGTAAVDGHSGLALGGLLGSSMTNMAILAVLDLVHRGRVWPEIGLGHARVAAVAIALTALALFGAVTPGGLAVGSMGIDTILIVLTYVAASAWMRRSPTMQPRRSATVPPPGAEREATAAIGPTAIRFLAAAVAIVVTGPLLTRSAEGIAQTSGVGETFVGVVLLAGATSFPELVVSLAAVRLGAYDVAVGNLFGSNAFNMVVLWPADLLSARPILESVDQPALVAGVGAIGLMALALAAIVHSEETRARRLEPDALVLLAAYVGAVVAVWWS
jgi:cation:H+ antiporter